VAREAEEGVETAEAMAEEVPSDQLSHEANEYRNWCKLMELNAMKNIATNESNKNGGMLMEEEDLEEVIESGGEGDGGS